MGGTLAITLREPDRTEHRLLGWNTVASTFVHAGIPEGDPAAVAHVLAPWTRMRADVRENGPIGPFRYRNSAWFAPPGLLAPEEYGLLVIDLAERVILDGQEGSPLDRIPLYRVTDTLEARRGRFRYPADSDAHRFIEFYRAGRVRTLYFPTLDHKVDLPPAKLENVLRLLTELRRRLPLQTRLSAWFSLTSDRSGWSASITPAGTTCASCARASANSASG